MGNTFFFQWEVDLIAWIQETFKGFWVDIFSFLSFFGEELIIVAVLAIVYLCVSKEKGKKLAQVVVQTQVFYAIPKNIFQRRRPYMDNDNIDLLKLIDSSADKMDIAAQGFSFPSGHSANAASVYGSLALIIKKKWAWIVAVVLTLLVGISRFALGAHFPTDVIVGYIIGIFSICLIELLYRYVKKEWLRYVILFVISVPGVFFCKTNDYFTGLGMLIGTYSGFLFEEKFVNFKDTKNWLVRIIRLVGAFGLYFGLNALLKLPFDSAFLESKTIGAFLVRTGRYTVVCFSVLALYPMLFKYFDKIQIKKKAK